MELVALASAPLLEALRVALPEASVLAPPERARRGGSGFVISDAFSFRGALCGDFGAYREEVELVYVGALELLKAARADPTGGTRVIFAHARAPGSAAELGPSTPLSWSLRRLLECARAEGAGSSVASVELGDLWPQDPDQCAARIAAALRGSTPTLRSPRAAHRRERLAPGPRRRPGGHIPSPVLVTGASSGLGRELARRLVRRTERLLLLARGSEELDALATELARECAGEVRAIALDLRDPVAVRAVARSLEPVGLLVQCAGVQRVASIRDTPLEAYRELLETNFLGPVGLLSGALESGALRTFVGVLSTAAIAGRRLRSAYAMSKAALWGASRSLARARPDLHVLEVMPSTFDSSVDAPRVAELVEGALLAGRSRLHVPAAARGLVWLEALAPGAYRRLFP